MSNRRAHSLQAHMMESSKPSRGRCVAAICFSWKIITCIVSHVTLVLLVVSYCVGGAYLFQHLERPHEMEVKKGIHYMRLNLTEKIWRLSDNVSVLNENDWMGDVKKDLAGFEKQILTAMKSDGWDGDEDITKSQWTFAGSLFYSIIVITTIGYGHISPRTDWGKVTTIFYAIIGIPLMLLCLSNIGDVMATSFRFIYWRVCCYICTRTSKRSRHRVRQRSTRGNRLTARSQPPPYRRSIKTPSIHSPSYGFTCVNLAHAYSDPELHRLGDRDFEYVRSNKRFHSSHGHGHNRDRDQHHYHLQPKAMLMTTSSKSSIGRHHHQHYGNTNALINEEPSYTQTLNRNTRYSNRHRYRERIPARHTVEREQYLSDSKQQFDSLEYIDDIPRSVKRTMSVRSIRSPRVRRSKFAMEQAKESQEMNHLVTSHPNDVGLRIVPQTSSARTRAKSVDHRLSMITCYDVDEESIRKTPIITNPYAISSVDYKKQQRTLRSHSMPRSAFDKSNFNHISSQQPHYAIHQQNYSQHSPHNIINHKRTGLNRQSSVEPNVNLRYGNRLELPTYPDVSQRLQKGSSPRRRTQNGDDHCVSEIVNDLDYPPTIVVSSNHRRSSKPKKEKLERLPPSPRIMSPMGFTVNRQVRRRYSYDGNDDDSCYGDGRCRDYYGEVSAKDRPVPIWLCVFLVISYILGGAALFAFWEEWSFLDSAYFCFITLTTIGFGDFVPAKGVKDESEQSIAYCSLYLLFGIALLAMSFNLVQEEFIANVKEVARRLGILKDEDDEAD